MASCSLPQNFFLPFTGREVENGMNLELSEEQRDPKPKIQVTIVALCGTGLTSVFGTADVFLKANEISGRAVYDVRIVSAHSSDSCPELFSACKMGDINSISHPIDTLLLAGGSAYRAARPTPQFGALNAWLRRYCSTVSPTTGSPYVTRHSPPLPRRAIKPQWSGLTM